MGLSGSGGGFQEPLVGGYDYASQVRHSRAQVYERICGAQRKTLGCLRSTAEQSKPTITTHQKKIVQAFVNLTLSGIATSQVFNDFKEIGKALYVMCYDISKGIALAGRRRTRILLVGDRWCSRAWGAATVRNWFSDPHGKVSASTCGWP